MTDIHTSKGPMPVLYEDKDIIAVCKPHGLHTIQDRAGAEEETVRSVLDNIYGKIYIVHRLDAGTGGVLLCAKTPQAHRLLNMEFEAGRVVKEYVAIVSGEFLSAVTLMLPIGPKISRGRYRINFTSGKDAVTSFIPITVKEGKSLVRAIPVTGRTHQIRVHLKAAGHPLMQDWMYNTSVADTRLTLFAERVRLAFSGRRMDMESDLSEFMQTKWQQ